VNVTDVRNKGLGNLPEQAAASTDKPQSAGEAFKELFGKLFSNSNFSSINSLGDLGFTEFKIQPVELKENTVTLQAPVEKADTDSESESEEVEEEVAQAAPEQVEQIVEDDQVTLSEAQIVELDTAVETAEALVDNAPVIEDQDLTPTQMAIIQDASEASAEVQTPKQVASKTDSTNEIIEENIDTAARSADTTAAKVSLQNQYFENSRIPERLEKRAESGIDQDKLQELLAAQELKSESAMAGTKVPNTAAASPALTLANFAAVSSETLGRAFGSQAEVNTSNHIIQGISERGSFAKTGTETSSKSVHQGNPSLQDKVVDKVKELVLQMNQSKDANTFVVRLDPPELGALTLKVTKRGEQMFARITPESKEVEDTLRSKLNDITSLLSQAGFRSENVHVTIGREASEAEHFSFQSFMEPNQGGSNSDQGNSANGESFRENRNAPFSQSVSLGSNSVVEAEGWVA
jgi:flagellar hook-length control protein FliK